MENQNTDSQDYIPKPSTVSHDRVGPKRHHIARKTLCAVGQKTTQIIERSKGKGGVVKFGIETMERLVEPAKSFTVSKWSTYGDPLLSKLDQKLDKAFLAFSPHSPDDEPNLVSGSPDDDLHKTVYFLYWGRLKDKFVSSQWFTLCNQILMQNHMVQAVTQKVYQPAEMFYNTVTDEFVAHESMEQYLEALKEKMGPTWDDRLAPLARAFYTSAKAVTAIVGAGRFMGGALQLGKSKIHTAIDDLLTRWDRVLGVTDDMLDQWLPENEKLGKSSSSQQKLEQKLIEDDDHEGLGSSGSGSSGSGDRGDRDTMEEGIFRMEEDDEIMESKESEMMDDLTPTLILRKQQQLYHEGGGGLRGGSSSSRSSSTCLSKTILRNMPMPTSFMELTILPWTIINHLGSELRIHLSYGSPSWFTRVDEVLLQNSVVRAISQGVIRPAEHFFNTAVDIFRSYYNEVDVFVIQLKTKLGSTWDDRLCIHSKCFFALAVDLKNKNYSKDHSSSASSHSSLSTSSS